MQMHYIVMAASADARGWRFFAGMDDARHPIWGESAKAVHFPTFQQARRVARRVGDAEICASLTTQEANR
jgi:hypothetical protein